MKITYLGTGTSQGIPIIGSTHPVCLSENIKDKRLRVSVLIEINGKNIVIDCGPDFRHQMLTNPIPRLDAIVFTHEHSDHTAGLDDIRPFFFKQGAINLYGNERVFNSLKQRFAYIFETENKYPGAPDVVLNPIKNKPFMVNGISIIPIRVLHNTLPVFGYRIENFAYITDVKTVPDEELHKLKNLEVLTISALRIEPHASHFNLEEALSFVEKVKPKKAYFTHISHLLGFHDEVESQLPDHIHLAYDNLKITL